MTTLTETIVEAGARAMRNSKAWPVVFSPGSAELLTQATLLAVLPMVVAEVHMAIVDSVEEKIRRIQPAEPTSILWRAQADMTAAAARSAVTALLSDLKSERGKG